MKSPEKSSTGGRSGVVGVIFNYALARLAPGLAVPRLVSALGSDREDTAMTAYMALVKLGPRIAPQLLNEARRGRQTAAVLQVFGDHGDQTIVPELEEFARSSDPAVAKAARDAVALLLQQNNREDHESRS
jgi:HEAT repeat protein